MTQSDGKYGVWPIDGSDLQLIPGLDYSYSVIGWTPDGSAVYAISSQLREKTAKVYRLNIATGKMEFWKTFGEANPAGVTSVGHPRLSSDGNAYAYGYIQALCETYVLRGLK